MMRASLKKFVIVQVTACILLIMLFYESDNKDIYIIGKISQQHPFPSKNSLNEGSCHSDEFKKCLTDPLSNEHEQYYKFVQIVNRHFNKDSEISDGSIDEVLEEYIQTCRENGRRVEYLFELWNNESKAEDYKWNIQEKTTTKDNDIFIKILETSRGIPTSGGSSFTFLQTSAHTKSFCPVTDIFNGTYLVKCYIHEKNTTIKGEVNFVNFTGFTKNKIKIHNTIFETKTEADHLKKKSCPLCDDPERGYWICSNNSWHWFTGSHVVPKAYNRKLELCTKQYSRMFFIGDSHIRYWFYYILNKMNKLPTYFPLSLTMSKDLEKFSFRWGNYADELLRKFTKELERVDHTMKSIKDPSRKQKPLFVLNCMAWNLMFRENTVGYFLGINKLVDLLKETIQKDLVRVIWISGLATDNRRRDQKASGYLFRAVNQIVLKKMESIGVETLDVNTMLYGVNQYPVDFVHYLQVHPEHQDKIKGLFGPGVADRIVEQICH